MKLFRRGYSRTLHPTHYVFAAVLAARLLALVRLTASPFLLPTRGDMYFYNDWAQRILHGQWSDHLTFYGLPGYAYFLAGVYKVFGYGPFVPGLLQACLDAGTATLLYKIGKRVFGAADSANGATNANKTLQYRGSFIGMAAAAGWALFVPAQAYSVILMPAAWLVFVFWLLVWQVVHWNRAPALLACLACGLLIGITAMGIATILFLVPLLVAAILLRGPRRVLWQAGGIAALVVGITLGTAPCWIHNYFVAHDPVLLSAHSGINFWIGNNPLANGYPRIPPGLRAGQAAMLQDSIVVAEAAEGRPLKRSEISAYWSAKAKNFISENPGAWVKLVGRKIANFWSAFQYDDLSIITNLRAQGVIWPGPRFGLVAALALPGVLLAVATFGRSRWVLAAILLHMASLLSVFVTERYRLAAVPGLLLFAAFGVWETWQNCSSSKYRRVAIYFAALTVATLFVSAPQKDPALWALDAYNSGWQALESQNLELAQEKLELAHVYVPDNAEITLALGNLWLERNNSARAERFYREALAIEPRHKSALSNLGVVALQTNRAPEAAYLFRAALRELPNDAKTHYLLARALLQTGERAEAFSEAEMAARLKPDQAEFADLRNSISEKP